MSLSKVLNNISFGQSNSKFTILDYPLSWKVRISETVSLALTPSYISFHFISFKSFSVLLVETDVALTNNYIFCWVSHHRWATIIYSAIFTQLSVCQSLCLLVCLSVNVCLSVWNPEKVMVGITAKLTLFLVMTRICKLCAYWRDASALHLDQVVFSVNRSDSCPWVLFRASNTSQSISYLSLLIADVRYACNLTLPCVITSNSPEYH